MFKSTSKGCLVGQLETGRESVPGIRDDMCEGPEVGQTELG